MRSILKEITKPLTSTNILKLVNDHWLVEMSAANSTTPIREQSELSHS